MLMQAGEQKAGVDAAGDGLVDGDAGDDREAEDVGDVAFGQARLGSVSTVLRRSSSLG